MKVISTEKSQILAARIATALNTSIVDVKFSRFPDGESYLAAGKKPMTKPSLSAVSLTVMHSFSCSS